MQARPDHSPRITVVTACLNAAKTIERTLKSIEDQAYPNLQLIVVDGLSRDGTVKIVHRYDHLVSTLIIEKDRNVADALNKGFRLADGDIFCYLNADDCFTPGALRRVAAEFAKSPEIDVVTGGCQRVFADNSTFITQVPAHFERLMALRNDIEQPSTFWRAAIHRKAGEFDVSYSLAFDWEWWNRLRIKGARFTTIHDVLSIYYFSDDNLTSNGGGRVVEEMYRVTKTYGPYRGWIADIYRLLFNIFDMRGYYDAPIATLSKAKQRFFRGTLAILYAIFGKDVINAYNWNWASKQIRGVVWYK